MATKISEIQLLENIKARVTGSLLRVFHQWLVNSQHKGPVTRKKILGYDVKMTNGSRLSADKLSSINTRLMLQISPDVRPVRELVKC